MVIDDVLNFVFGVFNKTPLPGSERKWDRSCMREKIRTQVVVGLSQKDERQNAVRMGHFL